MKGLPVFAAIIEAATCPKWA
ncbi:hypothetical protein PMI34_03814, partial [Pseudomonas sp. GM74]